MSAAGQEASSSQNAAGGTRAAPKNNRTGQDLLPLKIIQIGKRADNSVLGWPDMFKLAFAQEFDLEQFQRLMQKAKELGEACQRVVIELADCPEAPEMPLRAGPEEFMAFRPKHQEYVLATLKYRDLFEEEAGLRQQAMEWFTWSSRFLERKDTDSLIAALVQLRAIPKSNATLDKQIEGLSSRVDKLETENPEVEKIKKVLLELDYIENRMSAVDKKRKQLEDGVKPWNFK